MKQVANPTRWQRERCQLNHDWLKNRCIPALDRFLNRLDGRIDDDEAEVESDRKFLASLLPQWPERRAEFVALLRGFETEMSPELLFTDGPLARCPPNTRRWLEPVVRSLWLNRYPVRQWLVDGYMYLEAVDAAYRRVRQRIAAAGERPIAADLRAARQEFAWLRDYLDRLSKVIERFPSQIQVI
jgi:hypothetical protein